MKLLPQHQTLLLTTCFIIRENGTQRLLEQIQNAGKVNIPRAMIDEDTKYWLRVTAHNRLGASQSDPVILSLKDIGIAFCIFSYIMYVLFMSVIKKMF